ncbi:hypothetical protein DPMN_029586 [Dreissena polymorpha]|uniref:Uncharacterized protein n=1 Tax=Dreissena polymorpha TaxID=45954 RepID=A0A9D4LYU7_DREPO|nr:hypothetical protein DPMN_029586 [Dreissena polymorpha]
MCCKFVALNISDNQIDNIVAQTFLYEKAGKYGSEISTMKLLIMMNSITATSTNNTITARSWKK